MREIGLWYYAEMITSLLGYAKRKLKDDGVDTTQTAILQTGFGECECCQEIYAISTDPSLCLGCLTRDKRRCPEGSTNIYYLGKSFMCFEHAFSRCVTGCCKLGVVLERHQILPTLHRLVIDKILLFAQLQELNQDLLNVIACKLTEVCAIDKVLS